MVGLSVLLVAACSGGDEEAEWGEIAGSRIDVGSLSDGTRDRCRDDRPGDDRGAAGWAGRDAAAARQGRSRGAAGRRIHLYA